MSLDGFSLYAAATELHEKLSGGRVDRIFQPNKYTVLLQIRQTGQNYTLYISALPQNPVLQLHEGPSDHPPSPPVFCMVLRKNLEDGRIASIRQLGCDRVVAIDIDVRAASGRIATRTLFAELMGKYSNLILTEDGRIIDCLKKIGVSTSRVRQILPNRPYLPPPDAERLNLRTASGAAFIERLQTYGNRKLCQAVIASSAGVGPVTAKELCFRAGLPADIVVDELSASDFASLATEQTSLGRQMANGAFSPTVVCDESGKFIAAAAFPLYFLAADKTLFVHTFSTMSEANAYSTKVTGSYRVPERDILQRIVRNEQQKASHKLVLLKKEMAAALDAEQLRVCGDILMTYQYQATINKRSDRVTLPDLYSERPEANTVTIAIDPLLSLSQNAQSYYNKYNKAKRAQQQLALQIKQCAEYLEYLETIDASLESSDTLAEIEEIKTELAEAGFLPLPKKKKLRQQPSKPLQITAPDGTAILVGKNNAQNDHLTLKIAQPADIWLHTKDIPGSHVIIRTVENQLSEETLHLAAQLAAHFSKARDSTKIPVDYTQRRFVKKPNGSKPGFIIYTNQKTLFVSPDKELLNDYLGRV